MNTKTNQSILIIATALVVVAGLLAIPAITQQEADASKISEKLQKAQEKINKSLDKIKQKLNGDHDFHN